jgi:hypothetical protein
VAITAVARKLVTIAHLMLKNNEPYRYARPELRRERFARLRGSDPESAGGSPKSLRPGAVSGLAEVYRSAQVFPRRRLKAGRPANVGCSPSGSWRMSSRGCTRRSRSTPEQDRPRIEARRTSESRRYHARRTRPAGRRK